MTLQRTTRIELELTDAEVIQLREIMDEQPLRKYAPLIVKVQKVLPLESAAESPSPDSRRPALSALEESGRGFQLRAMTPRAVPMVEAIDNVLATLSHAGDV